MGCRGLGNPERRHQKTRHNAGFMAVEALADRLGARWRSALGGDAEVAPALIDGLDVLLVRPLTYMNLSGVAVSRILRRKNIPPENLIVIHDDIDMDTARLRIRKGGSSGGHKGVDSIIRETGKRDFIRVKIGIGRHPSKPAEVYVLERFGKDEAPLISGAVSGAAQAAIDIITLGLPAAMNRFNKK
ncbi:MAG: aminoacyl-tRNA hydrolase [Nitrospiraceae bacterium]|nr:aminoacyl-tRNA hydrolase [Nitrospiraceae bacterium]